jgi:8-oxo-dGTP pyrophosphatase MutT (NUDIX family)
VTWRFVEDEVKIPSNLESERERIWNDLLHVHPDLYDGRLLVLRELSILNDSVNFGLGIMPFSMALTFNRLGMKMDRFGALAMAAIVFSHNKKHILIGERTADSEYCPRYKGSPGGWLEESDVDLQVEDALMREVNEEMNLDVEPEKHLVALAAELHGTIAVNLLIEVVSPASVDVSSPVNGNEEWEERSLIWHPIDILDNLDEGSTMDALVFAKNEWQRYKENQDCVLRF